MKNSDRLPAEDKDYHLRKVLTAWGMLTGLAFKLVALLFENGTVKIGSFEFNFGASKIRDPRVIRIIVANVPQIVSQYTRMYAASGKLEEILKSMSSLADFPEFLRVAIICDLRMDELINEVKKFHKRFRSNPTMLESLLWKLKDSYFRFGLAKQLVQPLRQLIAEFSADIMGLKGSERDRSISGTIQRLSDQKLTQTVKSRREK